MAKWLLATKELNGGIYVTRMPHAINNGNSIQPGIPDNWFFVGPGTSPSVSEYNGNQFILMFGYLNRLIVRVLDVTSWPPTQVNPISVSGGTNPPNPFLFGITSVAPPQDTGILNDNYIFITPSSFMGTTDVKNQFDPPYLKHNLIFFDPTTNTYSVTLQPDPTWITNLPNTTNFFRLYRSPLGPPSWTLIEDWNTTFPTSFFIDSAMGSFQFQYAVTIGAFFNPANPGSTTDHEESAKGPILAFNSNNPPLGFQLTHFDEMLLNAGGETIKIPSLTGFGSFTATQQFFVLVFTDVMDYPGLVSPTTDQPSEALQDTPTSTALSVGGRGAFIAFPQSDPGAFNDDMPMGNSASHAFSTGANGACSVFG